MLDLYEQYKLAIFIVSGAVAHVVMKYAANRKASEDTKEALDAIDYLIMAGLAAFAGLVGANITNVFTPDQDLKMAMAGLAGFIGPAGLQKLADGVLGFLTRGSGK